MGAVGAEGPTFPAVFIEPARLSAPSQESVVGTVLIDTGAGPSVVNERIIDTLGLVPIGATMIETPGNPP